MIIRLKKEQAEVISTIDGKVPLVKVASQSYFNDYLEVRFEDPEDIVEEPLHIETNVNDYLKSYYGLFSSLSDKDLLLLKPMGVELSFDDTLKQAFKIGNYSELSFRGYENMVDEDNFRTFPDGIKLRLNSEIWNVQNLGLNPNERS